MIEIDANVIINNLASTIAQKEVQIATLQAQVAKLQEESTPKEG